MVCAAEVMVSPKLNNILLPTDFSACSEAALPYVRTLAEQYGATVHVAHVIPMLAGLPFGATCFDQPEADRVEQQLCEITHSDAFRGISCREIVKMGQVRNVLPQLVADGDIDLIVLASHPRSSLEMFLDGSVAEYVFRRATCPVLTIGPEVQNDAWPGGKLSTILYSTDFLADSARAVQYALSLARKNDASLVLFHVLHGVARKYLHEAVRSAEVRLLDLLPEQVDIDYRVQVECGPVAENIVEAARGRQADLIIMGAHPEAPPYLPWTTAHKMVRTAPCPVLTIPTN